MNCECEICKNNKPFELPEEIVEATINGDLVLFCGAGISTEGKIVLPFSFYESIKEDLNIKDDKISFSCLMQKYCDKPNGRKKLLKKIWNRFQYIRSFPELERMATSFHRELAEIYSIKTIITTNWDTFFEEHCGAIPITIPEDFAFWDEKSRYVLKIHGSIQNLSSIVATSKDYNRCIEELQKGVIGAQLKTILATKTVVFIGYSFGDEDFNQIINYLRNEMGEIYPHIYVVTLDETLKERLEYKNCTSILTSGTFFLHQLKSVLIDKGEIKNSNISSDIELILNMVKEDHDKICNIDLAKYPEVVYTLSYQDGVIHSFERFLQNYKTGEYNVPGYIERLVEEYEDLIDKVHEKGKFFDEVYYEGYANGLTLIDTMEYDYSIVNEFPFFYLPNSKRDLKTYPTFIDELNEEIHEKDMYFEYAKKFVDRKGGKDLIFHHPPYSVY